MTDTETAQSSAEYKGVLPVPRIDRAIRKRYGGKRVSPNSAVFTTAVLEHMFSEVLSAANAEATSSKKKRISREHLIASIRTHPELGRFFLSYAFAPKTKVVFKADDLLNKADREVAKKAREEAQKKRSKEGSPPIPAVDED